jgi:aldehyde:ferredoxin oxidoreductase
MRGFFNIALRVDATHESFEIETIPDSVLKNTLGGKGLATHLLLKYNPPGVDPLGTENHLIFAVGPATRTALWGSCRYGVFTKSPLTGGYAESYSGGTAAEHMVGVGADAVMIYGASPEPVWLEVTENSVLFHPARELWGLDTYRTQDRIVSWLKGHRPQAAKAGVVTIGPAGENRVAFAVIEDDYRCSAGRTVVDAVMGSKKIKAIAFWGNRRKEIADPGRMKQFASDLTRASKNNPGVKAYKAFGTPMFVDTMNKAGMLDPNRIEGTGRVFAEWEDRLTFFDTLILCPFYRDLYQWEQLSTIVAAATGMDLNVKDMRSIAAHVASGARRFNLREGLTAADDRLPPRFTREPLPESISAEDMETMLQEYYEVRGWDPEGRP